MGNSIKYTTGTEANSLIKGNFRIGTGDVGKGPSSSTGFYKATSPPEGGYRVYLYNDNLSGDISYFRAANDSELISFTNGFLDPEIQEPFTTVEECFNYYNSSEQTEKFCTNKEITAIPTDSIYTHYDFGQVTCRPNSDSNVRELGKNGSPSQIINGPSFTSSNEGGIVLDGINQYVTNFDESLVVDSGNGLTICMWVSNFTPGESNNPFLHNGANFTYGYLRYSISLGTPLGMEWFITTPDASPGGFYRGGTKMTLNTSYPIFLCLNFINRGEGNYGCYLITNNGTSGLVGGNFGAGYSSTGSNVLSTYPLWGAFTFGASVNQARYLNGTINMVSGYNKSFFPITTDVPADDTIPAEIQQYYNATKGRFGL
jgi:hypothetical protein